MRRGGKALIEKKERTYELELDTATVAAAKGRVECLPDEAQVAFNPATGKLEIQYKTS